MKFITVSVALFSLTTLSACSPNDFAMTDTAAKPTVKRIKKVQVVEYVTCDPKRAKQLQKEIDARKAAREKATQS